MNQAPDSQAPDLQEPLPLRSSPWLARIPEERPAAAPAAAASAPVPPPPAPPPKATNVQPRDAKARLLAAAGQLPLATMAASGIAVLAAAGWLVERRRRLMLEVDKDSVMWARIQPAKGAAPNTGDDLDDILPDSPDPAEAARNIYVTAIGETNSRREATLIDLHQLEVKLNRRREKGDTVAAVLLLQQHLVDFRYTSPWVFLELLELYRVLDRHKEWEIAREAFRTRFGQNAPAWNSPSTAQTALEDDQQLSGDIMRRWPLREARMFILRWMLGEHEARQRGIGPPQLPLGIYRDMMELDNLLDEVMQASRAPMRDSLL